MGLTNIDGTAGCGPPESMTSPTQSLGQWRTETLSGRRLPSEPPTIPSSAPALLHPSRVSTDTPVSIVIDTQVLVFGLVSVASGAEVLDIVDCTLRGSPGIHFFEVNFLVVSRNYLTFRFCLKNKLKALKLKCFLRAPFS